MLFGLNVPFVIHTITLENAIVEIGNGTHNPNWIEFQLKNNKVVNIEALNIQSQPMCKTEEKNGAI